MHDQDILDSEALFRLFDRPIAYHKCFADISGSVVAAVMLSQSVYWTKTLSPEKDGWFYKTAAEWQEETGMTRSEQESARRKLKTIGVLQEKKEGVPCKLYYRVNILAMRELILGTRKIVDLDTFLEINEQSLLSLSRTGLMRAAKLQAKSEYVDYRDVVKTHGLHCHVCDRAIDFGMNMDRISFDHVIPLSKGGSHTFDNIRPAHQKCNQQKGAKTQEELCLSEQSVPVCQSKANKDVLTKQPRVSKQNNQDGFVKANNLYTEITTEITTEIRADEFFAIAPSSLNQENSFPAQTTPRIEETPNPQSPLSPSAPENSPKKVYPDPMGDRFRAGKPKHRHSTLVLSNPEWKVLDDWCTGLERKDFKPMLIKATIAHLKKWKSPFEFGDAVSCLCNYIKHRDLDSFEGRVQDALDLEATEAIATQQQQVEQQRFQQPDDTAPTMTPEQRKQFAADLKRRQFLKKLAA